MNMHVTINEGEKVVNFVCFFQTGKKKRTRFHAADIGMLYKPISHLRSK